ncbi:MAG: HAD family phosphatase [Actinomycetes bacterium]
MQPGLLTVLFDMDGLLVDTEPQWFEAETETARWLGLRWTPEDQRALLGSNLPFAADYMVAASGSDVPLGDVMAHLRSAMTRRLVSDGVTLRPGAAALVESLIDEGIPLGLVTSSVREHVDVVVRMLPDDAFEVTVTADDVTRLKPHPQPYLQALGALGAAPTSTVVLEDSPTGVASAEAAGCRVVAVPSVADIPAAPGRHVTASLTNVDTALLRRLVATRS